MFTELRKKTVSIIMTQYEVFVKRIVSADGKVIAEAKSVVSTSGKSYTNQTVSVSVSGNSCHSSSSAYSVSRG